MMSEQSPPLALLPRQPWYFKAVSWWLRSGIRGGYRWLERLKRQGRLDVCAPFPLDHSDVYLPLDTTGVTDPALFDYYEKHALDAVSAAARQFDEQPAFIDCGADVGLYTRLLLNRGVRPASILAIEPNPRTFAVLEANVESVSCDVTCFNGAVGDTPGRGHLQTPSYDPNQDRAAYVDLDDAGEIEIETVDRLLSTGSARPVVLKVDVEGAELSVLRGAIESLRAAPDFVVQFEAHPVVAERSGIDPIECLALLIDLGATHWTCSVESSGQVYSNLTADEPFFAQMSGEDIFDVVVTTRPPP